MSVSFRKREAVYERRDGIKTGWDDARYDQQKRERGGMPLETDGNPARAAQKLTFNASSWDNLSNKCLQYKK